MKSLCRFQQAGAFPFYIGINTYIQNIILKQRLPLKLSHYRFPINTVLFSGTGLRTQRIDGKAACFFLYACAGI